MITRQFIIKGKNQHLTVMVAKTKRKTGVKIEGKAFVSGGDLDRMIDELTDMRKICNESPFVLPSGWKGHSSSTVKDVVDRQKLARKTPRLSNGDIMGLEDNEEDAV